MERGAVLTGHGAGGELGPESGEIEFIAVGGHEGPAQGVVDVRAGDKDRRAADLLVLIGGVLGDLEVSRLHRGRGDGLARGNGRGSRGVRGEQHVRPGNGENLRGILLADKDRVAVGQTGDGELLRRDVIKARVAALVAGEGVVAGRVELLGRDLAACGVEMGDGKDAAVDLNVLERIGFVADDAVRHAHRGLDRIHLGVGEDHAVIEHIGPGVFHGVVVGIDVVRQNVGEGFVLLERRRAGDEAVARIADFPDLQVCGTVEGVLGGGDQLKAVVVVEVGDCVVPADLTVGLPPLVQPGDDQVELIVRVHRGGQGFALLGVGREERGDRGGRDRQSAAGRQAQGEDQGAEDKD